MRSLFTMILLTATFNVNALSYECVDKDGNTWTQPTPCPNVIYSPETIAPSSFGDISLGDRLSADGAARELAEKIKNLERIEQWQRVDPYSRYMPIYNQWRRVYELEKGGDPAYLEQIIQKSQPKQK